MSPPHPPPARSCASANVVLRPLMTPFLGRRYEALPCYDTVAQGFLMPVLVGACVDDAAAAAAAAGGANARTNWERPEVEWVQELQDAGFTVKEVLRDGLQLIIPSTAAWVCACACAAAADGPFRYWWAPAVAIVATAEVKGSSA